ncbi:MAG: DM13 domain-containing protein [Pseudomonadota bacterium]
MTPIARIVFAAALGAVAFTAAPTVFAQTVSASGQFTGKNRHVTTGGVTIQRGADGTNYVVLGNNFSLDGAPDPHVLLARPDNGAIDLGLLRSNDGGQTYQVPAGVDVSAFNRVIIWCERFSVSLGSANLS